MNRPDWAKEVIAALADCKVVANQHVLARHAGAHGVTCPTCLPCCQELLWKLYYFEFGDGTSLRVQT